MEEYPLLEATYKKESDRLDGVVMLGLNIRQSSQALEKFALESGYTIPILMDPAALTAYAYGVSGIPATFFIDRGGVIRDIQYGAFTSEGQIQAKLAKITGAQG